MTDTVTVHRMAALSRAVACAVAVTAIGIMIACGGASAPESTTGSASAAASAPGSDVVTLTEKALQAEGIVIEPAKTERRSGYFEMPGVFQLDETRTTRVGSVVEGVVVDAEVQVGARVAKGSRLAGIHSHMVHDAWAGYRRAVAEKRHATTELAFATDTEARTLRLLDSKAVSRQEAERARTERAAAEEALVIAESELTRSLAELEHLGIPSAPSALNDSADDVPVTAAYGGVVLERLVTNGTAVTVGSPMFVVSDLSRLWAVAEVDEARLPALAVGQAVELAVAAYPERSFTGRIIAVGDAVNPQTRRVTARIEVDNKDGSLKPQMFATVRFPLGEQQEVVVVPASAVQKIGAQTVVFVYGDQGRFTRRSVVAGAERLGTVEIRSGLKDGERVATTGTFLIKSKFLEGGQAQ
jgi:membrane fusion protein, heavy metal efflux system